jgi:hypothetical protein
MLLLAGYLLLFPPLFVLGPLAGLLIASRPATWREWAWIAAAGLWLAVSGWQPGGLAEQTLHAWALFVTAAFVLIMLTRPRPMVPGALLATVVGLVMVTSWSLLLGTRWQDIQLAVAHNGWEFCRAVLAAGSGAAPVQLAGIRKYVDTMGEMVGVLSDLFPAVLVLTALPGLALAWTWYHRLASHPVGAPAERFVDFRGSDQLVWAVVLSVAVFVLPTPPLLQDLAGNIALVAGGLYTARGMAVATMTMRALPRALVFIVMLGVLFVLPVALGGLFALGLADTWVDFRRRFQPANLTRE